ncbi:MAG: zinc ribbon domain-containing protein [Lachnospiraceae bacterium]|nr:zinc ribbon domain-containing protein [Lachnospiraceae bacterium]
MICPECKKEISDTAKFCRFCGTKIEQKEITQPDTDMKDCPFCGKSIKRTAKFCKFCGENIAAWKQESPEPEPVFEEEVPAAEEPEPVPEEKEPAAEKEPEPVPEEEEPAAEEEPEPVLEEEEPASEEKSELVLEVKSPAAEEPTETKKKSVDIDESVFEDDREFLYEGITMESSKVPLWGMPSVNADKLTALENTCRNGDHAEFQPYYRTLRPIAFEKKDTTPESIFNSSLGSYAMHREPEPAKSEENEPVHSDRRTGEGTENREKMQGIGSLIDDSRREVLSQKINSDNSGYLILAFLGALLLFTIVIVSFTRLILPGLSADAGRDEKVCLTETADMDLYADLSFYDYDLIEELSKEVSRHDL